VERVWGPSCRVVVARELTKLHEEILRGTAQEVREKLSARDRVRGEIVLLIDAQPKSEEGSPSMTVQERMMELAQAEGLDEMDALKRIARERGVAKSEVYRELQREKRRAGR